MKRKLLPILFILLLMPACVHRPMVEVRSLLEEAEGMIRTSPDTAYFLLREMGATMDLETEEDSAYHGLLLMEARVKNNLELTDKHVASLEELTHYYQEQKESLMQVRLLRLRGLAYRDCGRYEEAVKCYNAAIGDAKRMGEKRLLADMYQELAHLHYSGFLIFKSDSCKLLSDSLFNLTIQTAKELDDSVLWMKSLMAPTTVARHREGMMDYEHRLLQALDLAVALKERSTEAVVSMYLSMVYGEKGKSDESLLYAKRNLLLRQGTIPEYLYCLTLGNAFQRIGYVDSASYYLNKGYSLRGQENLGRFSVPSSMFLDKGDIRWVEMFMERLRQKGEFERVREQKLYLYALLWIAVFMLVVVLLIYLVKKSQARCQAEGELRKVSEELRIVLEREKGELEDECHSVQIQLQQKEQFLQKEKEVLQKKEEEIKSLQLQLDMFLSDSGRVFDKIKQMAADFRQKDSSDLEMDEKDWGLLLLAMDRKEDGSVTRIQHEYQLSEQEVRLLCLHLAGIATSQIFLFLGISRNTLYEKNNEMFIKMGIKRTSATFKKDIQDFLKNRK